jgi:FtsP/CotA-like multicopper oxidase with cupredoxin domain
MREFAQSRRAVLAGAGALVATGLTCCGRESSVVPSTRLRETRVGSGGVMLDARERMVSLGTSGGATPAWLYGETLPVLRMKQGESLDATLVNGLAEHSSIHWHGVRVPNAMDGVPYVTQLPVLPGERFTYRFAPPDAGTFFFHPHCNTAVQLGRGLAGVLIVEDETSFDDDIVCALKDWRLNADGSFQPFLTLEGAGRSGTYGNLRTVNGVAAPEIKVPASADIRLRVLNLDSTRVGDIGIEGAQGFLIATDGNALPPFALESWRLGPAMRMDLALRTPPAGERVRLIDYFAREPVILATLVAEGAGRRRTSFAPPVLAPPTLPEPDLDSAERHELRLSASAIGSQYPALAPLVLPDGRSIDVMDSLCSTSRTLWAIDGKTWPETGHERMPPPLLEYRRGSPVRLTLVNTTPHMHPMHLHGHSFKVLSSSRLRRPPHWADTVLVMPEERVEIAFVADNPGNWMLHCHIIEHQDTGMMGWFRVA